MITEFGKLLRFYRIENGMILKEMAEILEIPSSYLSSIEMGRKAVSKEFLEKLFEKFSFTEREKEKLTDAAQKSVYTVKLNIQKMDEERKDLALTFARKFDTLNSKDVEKLLKFLNGEDK